MEKYLSRLHRAIVDGDEVTSEQVTLEALEAGVPAGDILKEGLIPGIREIGQLFGKGEAYLPELIVAGEAMEKSIAHLEPHFDKDDLSSAGSYLIGTVAGDVHDIGKNIVSMMLKGNGWKVTDLGVDISPEDICRHIKEGDYDILGLSALLTTTMRSIDLTIDALTEAGLRDSVKIMIGGAPVNQEYADQVGADAVGFDAWDTIVKADALFSGSK